MSRYLENLPDEKVSSEKVTFFLVTFFFFPDCIFESEQF